MHCFVFFIQLEVIARGDDLRETSEMAARIAVRAEVACLRQGGGSDGSMNDFLLLWMSGSCAWRFQD